MINIDKLISDAVDQNLDNFVTKVKENPDLNVISSQARIYEALMNFSSLLLKEYHEELKKELAKKNIEI